MKFDRGAQSGTDDFGVVGAQDRGAAVLGEGVELGRVVETAERPIEELLLEFVAPAEGW